MKEKEINKLFFKNSAFDLLSRLVGKIGGLIFTVLLARLLLPESFGLYNLTLSIVLIAMTFSEMGIGTTSIRYLSKTLGEKNYNKFRGYFYYLFKLRIAISLVVISILLISTKHIAINILGKEEIVIPLVFASAFIFANALKGIYMSFITSLKQLEKIPVIEASFQISKIVLSILAIYVLSDKYKIAGIFLGFAISILISWGVAILLLGKDRVLLKGKKEKIAKGDLMKYIGFMGVTSLSLTFFASIDTLMLGKFLEVEFVGFYRAGLSLILAISALFAFSDVLLPIFTQLKKSRLGINSKMIIRYILLIAIPAAMGMSFLSKRIVLLVFGNSYIIAHNVIYVMSALVIIFPLTSFFTSLYQARGEIKKLAKYTTIALIVNIFLNYILIKNLLVFGEIYSVIGAGIATTFSWAIMLTLLASGQRIGEYIPKKSLIRILLSGSIMSLVIYNLSKFVAISKISSLVIILLGVITYGLVLLSLNEITKEDFENVKSAIKYKQNSS